MVSRGPERLLLPAGEMKGPLVAALRSLLVCGGTPLVLGACTLVGAGVAPGPAPGAAVGGGAAHSAPTPVGLAAPADMDRLTAQVVEVALESLGTPYEWGGTDANGFDCSGLIRFAYGHVGVRLPRTSAEQLRVGADVPPEPDLLRPGDILGFSGDAAGKADHVGLFIGADQFIHSGSSGVRVSTLRNPYWRERLVAARRPVA